jgi:YihY family inner membrane protein
VKLKLRRRDSAQKGQRQTLIIQGFRRIDRWQQNSRNAGFVVGVVKKYGDDRGGQLSSLIAFSAFLSFFPLMLVVVTLTAIASQRYASVALRIRNSAIAEFPVVGPELVRNNFVLPKSGVGLVVGLVGLLWAGLGFTHALQYAFLEVWHVPHKARPSFLLRLARSASVYALLAVGIVSSVVLGFLGSLVKNSRAAGAVGLVGAFFISLGIYLAVFWLLSPRNSPLGELLPGAVVAAIGWQGLQVFATQVVGYQLRRSSELYGAIGASLGLVWFLILSSQILIYALEITVVSKDRLWPRSLLQPPLTTSDMTLLRTIAKQEERRPEETITVSFSSVSDTDESEPISNADNPGGGRTRVNP